MANTAKGRTFVNEPMDGKPVTDVPGIGEITATILKEKGIDEAEELYEVYLECETNKAKFQKWMRTNCNMIPKVSDLVFEALDTWNKKFHEDLRLNNDEEDNCIPVPKRNRDNAGSESSSSPKEELAKQLYLNQQEQVVRSDAIMTFFVAMAKKVALLPPNLQDLVEKEVYEVIMNAKAKKPSEEASGKPVFKFAG